MAEETVKSPRYRINVAVSVKGVRTWDITVETDSMEKTLRESDQLVAEMEVRNPAPMTEGG